MPRVTVVTATYNWSTVLPFAVGSVLGQTFADLEYLVVGDGCTDDSGEVVARAAAGDRRVRWLNLPINSGHQWGPNAEGIRQSDSELIAYLGHDDLWAPTHLERLVAAVEPGVGLAHSSTLMVYPDRLPYVWPEPGWVYEPPEWVPPSSVVHRRDLAVAAGNWSPPDPDSPSDPEAVLWEAIAARAAVRWVPRPTCVKLPAFGRRNVYRDRPCHEQAYWSDRISAADDAERALAAAAGSPYALADPSPRHWMATSERVGWAVRTRARRLVGRPPVTGEERTRLRRRFKGLEP